MITIVGQVVDAVGHSAREELHEARHSPLGVESRLNTWRTDAASLHSAQAKIPVTIDHRPELTVGEVLGLRRLRSGAVHAVAIADCDRLLEADQPIYFSPTINARARDGSDAVLLELGLTFATTRVAAQPVSLIRGDLRRDRSSWSLNGHVEQLVDTALAELRSRRGGGPLTVTGAARPAQPDMRPLDLDQLVGPPALEYRAASPHDVTVTARNRLITLILLPYQTAMTVVHRGRHVRQTIVRGALSATDPTKVKVFLGEDKTRPIGRLVYFDPHDERGPVARLKIAPTQWGDHALEEARAGRLRPAAAYRAVSERWEPGHRIVTEAKVRSIALVGRESPVLATL